jgi:DsbC/DsbD-like thiol-disulfide interchange protein
MPGTEKIDSTMRYLRTLFALLLVTLTAGPAAVAASSSADALHLRVQLVAPERTLSAGSPADVGFYFKLEPGWHVYWKNAGDSGEPPHVSWTLPEGVTAGDLQFPAPKRLPLGPLMDFGYEDEVLFPLTLQVAQGAKTGAAPLHAKVQWLVCREVCIPGKAELEVPVTIAGAGVKPVANANDESLFKRLL